MQLRWGGISEEGFEPNPALWRPIKEPSPWVFQLLALPVGLLTTILVLIAWMVAVGPNATSHAGWLWAALFVAMVPAHEFLHALVHPGNGRLPETIIGFWPSKLVFYAHYEGEMSRNRFLAVMIVPFIVLSAIPIGACAVVGSAPMVLIVLTALHALLASADILGCILLLPQVPSNAVVRNKGWRTWWMVPV